MSNKDSPKSHISIFLAHVLTGDQMVA